jgi:hypothetical protein
MSDTSSTQEATLEAALAWLSLEANLAPLQFPSKIIWVRRRPA